MSEKSDELKATYVPEKRLVPGPDSRGFFRKLGDTVTAVWIPVVLCTSVGLTLIILAMSKFDHEHPFREVVTHIGGAFLVAGIVAFGFEWAGEVGRVRTLTAMLANTLYEYETKILRAPIRESVINAMSELMNGERDLAARFPEFGVTIGELAKKGSWTSSASIAYIRESLTQLATRTSKLAQMGHGAGADVLMEMPDPLDLVDVFTEGIVHALIHRRGDGQYLALSDIFTWTKLGRLKQVQQEAAQNITLKRLFVLGLEADRHISVEKLYETISEHREWARGSKYEIRLLMYQDYQCIPRHELSDAKHFAIFDPAASDLYPLALLSRNDDISKLRMMKANEAMFREFDALWSRGEPITATNSTPATVETRTTKSAAKRKDRSSGSDRVVVAKSNKPPADAPRPPDVVLEDFVLGYYIKRMPNDGHYKGISRLKDWAARRYEVFAKSARESFRRKGIRAERIFIHDDPAVDPRRAAGFLRQLERLRLETDDRCQWRICLPKDVNEELYREVPFGFYNSASQDDPSSVVRERVQPAKRFQQRSDSDNDLLDESFSRLWKKCEDPRKFVARVMPDWHEHVFHQV